MAPRCADTPLGRTERGKLSAKSQLFERDLVVFDQWKWKLGNCIMFFSQKDREAFYRVLSLLLGVLKFSRELLEDARIDGNGNSEADYVISYESSFIEF